MQNTMKDRGQGIGPEDIQVRTRPQGPVSLLPAFLDSWTPTAKLVMSRRSTGSSALCVYRPTPYWIGVAGFFRTLGYDELFCEA
jgi:hypothetical protein